MIDSPQQIVLASSNPGKLRECQQLLAALPVRILPQSHFAIVPVAETGLSFVENALLKARQAAHLTGQPALADDSGLAVDALQGQPGIYSARYAGPTASAVENNDKLLQQLLGVSTAQRTARFHCVVVYLHHAHDPMPIICQGTWHGAIADTPRGTGGFGYDPLFWLADYDCTAAELTPARKNQHSHRAQALRCLVTQLKQLWHHDKHETIRPT